MLLSALLLPAAAQAQDAPPLPDPATIKAPDVTLSQDANVRKDGYKFYYFHNPDVSFAEAVQDLRECRAYLSTAGLAQVPGFIPWDEAHRRRVVYGAPAFGLVGLGLAAILVPKEIRGSRSNIMRRCMGTRGYVRYAIPEKTFDLLNDGGDEQQLILMQAKLATGPKPQDSVVDR
jgi:hypothetical protein